MFLKRLHARYAFAFPTALLISGCSSVPKGAATAAIGQSVSAPELAQKASWSAYVSASPLSDQLTTATITDPSLNNMVAATKTIPAGWKLEGIEMMPLCTAAPSPVYRAYSPNGLMQLRQEPYWDGIGTRAPN